MNLALARYLGKAPLAYKYEMDSPNNKKRPRMATPDQPVEMEPECAADYLGLPAVEPPPELPEARFVHFKILYDPSWDYKKICKKFFVNDEKYLCVLEHINRPNTHVHFQGMCLLADATVKNRLTRLAAHHHLRKINPKSRPTSMSCRPVDVKGFQYMAKELKKEYVLAHNGFTLDDLKKLKEDSVMHCTVIKTAVKDRIAGWDEKYIKQILRVSNDDPRLLLDRVGAALFAEQHLGKFDMPEYNAHHTRTSVIRGLMANPHIPVPMKGRLMVL